MRTLKSSERRLITVFGGLIFILANLLVLEQVSEKKFVTESRIRKLNLEKTEADFWLSQKDIWFQRKAWLDEKQPQMAGTGQESAELLDTLQKGAKDQKITLGERTIFEPLPQQYYTEIAVQLQAKGSLEAISRWLASLQQPEAFQAITNLTLKKDAESANILCSLTVSRWYRVP